MTLPFPLFFNRFIHDFRKHLHLITILNVYILRLLVEYPEAMPKSKDQSESQKKSGDGNQVILSRPLPAAPLCPCGTMLIPQKGYQGQTVRDDADRSVDMTERNDTTHEASPLAPYTGRKK